MEAGKAGTPLKLDPKVQELYGRLEEEKRKNRHLSELKKENSKLVARINQLESEKVKSEKRETEKIVQRTKKRLAIQDQLQGQKIKDHQLKNKQKRINILIDSLSDMEEIQEVDSGTISELKETLDTLIHSRNKRIELIKKLSQQNKHLHDRNEDLEFTREKLAHDLRSLMSSILGTLSLIDLDEKEVALQLMPSLETRCRLFMDLVITINEDKIEKDFLTIDQIADVLNLKPEESDVQVELSISGEDVHIFADRAALYTVIQNLVNNSIKYAGVENGALKINIDVSQDENSTYLRVSDNGIGIQADKAEKIFDLYNRAGIDDAKGKGIGLYMVKRLIDKHDGTVTYNQEYKKGSQFVITLPSAPEL